MPNGFGRGFGFGRGGGFGFRGGMGFGFRGSSPPWPYVGIGRGGLPRHAYFFGGAAGAPSWPYQTAAYPAGPGFGFGQSPYPPYAAAPPAFGNAPFGTQVTPEQELDFLKDQAEAIKEQLEQIESRMHELENEEKK